MKISIITACLNSNKTILKTIQSVNSQIYNNIEHIFIDGGSTDDTKEIINNNAERNVKIIVQQSSGIYNAMNLGIKNSSGDIIAFLNSDDFYTKNDVIEKIIGAFSGGFEIVYGNICYFDHKRNSLGWRTFKPGSYYPKAYLNGWHAPHPAFFIKRDSIQEFFDESCQISADFKFMFYHQEIVKLKSKYIDLMCVVMGLDGNSQKLKNIFLGNKNIIKSLKGYYRINNVSYLIKRFMFKLKSSI